MKKYTEIDAILDADVVSLDTAKHLKELGFNLPTYYFYLDKDLPYVEKGLKRVNFGKRRMNHNKYDEFIYSAPPTKQAEKWLKNKQ